MVSVGGLEALITSVLRKLISKLEPCLPARMTFGPGGGRGLKIQELGEVTLPDYCVCTYFAK